MSKPIWMPLYIGDYIADTIDLSNSEHGAYLLAMMCYWRKSGPLEEYELESICKDDFERVSKFFQHKDGKWHHKRIDFELFESTRRSDAAKNRAEKASKARWGNDPPPITKPPKEKNEPVSTPEFERFWSLYPKKLSKLDAIKAFGQVKAAEHMAEIEKTLAWQVKSLDWTKERGQYVPHAGTWLRAKRWEDQAPGTSKPAPAVNGHLPAGAVVRNEHGDYELKGLMFRKDGTPYYFHRIWTLARPPVRTDWGPEAGYESSYQTHLLEYERWQEKLVREFPELKAKWEKGQQST